MLRNIKIHNILDPWNLINVLSNVLKKNYLNVSYDFSKFDEFRKIKV
jgi:hypothetical protein